MGSPWAGTPYDDMEPPVVPSPWWLRLLGWLLLGWLLELLWRVVGAL